MQILFIHTHKCVAGRLDVGVETLASGGGETCCHCWTQGSQACFRKMDRHSFVFITMLDLFIVKHCGPPAGLVKMLGMFLRSGGMLGRKRCSFKPGQCALKTQHPQMEFHANYTIPAIIRSHIKGLPLCE